MAGSVHSEEGNVGFQIAPMVDVVFVLLLFFMASAGSQVVEKELTLKLPSHGSSADLALIISISREGEITMNGEACGAPSDHSLGTLREKLRILEGFGGHDPVIIRPDGDARHERIIDVLNACSHAGIHNLSFI